MKWSDESCFRFLIVSQKFQDLTGTKRKPGKPAPVSMAWDLRQRIVLDTIEAAAKVQGVDIDRATLWPVPLTEAEYDGKETVPASVDDIGEGGIGMW